MEIGRADWARGVASRQGREGRGFAECWISLQATAAQERIEASATTCSIGADIEGKVKLRAGMYLISEGMQT